MAQHEVVQVVTQPFHGPDGIEVLYSPGDTFPDGHELPEGVRTTLSVAEVADTPPAEPEPASAMAAGKAAAKG